MGIIGSHLDLTSERGMLQAQVSKPGDRHENPHGGWVRWGMSGSAAGSVLSLSLLLAGSLFCVLPVRAQLLDGAWKSEGYGNVYEIRGNTLKAFEVTTQTCVLGFSATRIPPRNPGQDEIFRAKGRGPIVVSAGKGADDKVLDHSVQIDRLPQLPPVCTAPTENTPLGNFEVFADTFAEHYIAFDLRHFDWDKIVAANRQKVTPHTTPRELFEILDSMIRPLGDLHTGIEAPQLKRESKESFRAGTDRIIKNGIDAFATKGRRTLFAVTDTVWLHGSIKNLCNGQVQYGRSSSGTGYMRILSFGGYSKLRHDTQALESTLDRIFSDPMLKALIIDVRLSFGGDDLLGRIIASRLTDREYMAYAIQARSDPLNPGKWTSANQVFVRPSSRPGFRGPVVELIGPITMSAAETFTEALMGRTPRITMVGENTQGLFCDPLGRHLPNGWSFYLPNAVYRTTDGSAFDVQGIPPNARAPVFADDDVVARKDPAMSMAIQILAAKSR
jgi:hypothetical protein